MTRWRQAPWPVIFAVCTVLFAVLALAWDQLAGADSTGLPYAAPVFGAAMTWWFVRQRNHERAQAGFDADQHADAERAVLRGELPPDPAGWPGARTVLGRHRDQLHRYRYIPLLFGLLGIAFLGLGLGGGVPADYAIAAVMLAVAAVGALSSARLRRRLDAAESALDAAETGSR
jgi:drug/metabolite transporter (DMT)-like permease